MRLFGLFQLLPLNNMSEPANLKHVILNTGIIQHQERDLFQPVLCKPKLMPLKSVTLQRLEDMQKLAEEKLRQQQINTSTSESNQ